MDTQATDISNGTKSDNGDRQKIAMTVLWTSIGGILLLALCDIFGCWAGKGCGSEAKDLLNVLLPVFGTWIGTLLAFYFSKDNFDAATKSMSGIVSKLSFSDEKLKQIPAKDKMRPLKDMDVYTIKRGDEGKCVLSSLLDEKKYERIPMVDETGRLVYLVYKATVNQFLSRLALGKVKVEGKTAADVSLGDALVADSSLKDIFQKSFGFVAQTASLSDAQREIERVSKTISCNDVFVTATGRSDEPVLGWVTDNTIAENLKV